MGVRDRSDVETPRPGGSARTRGRPPNEILSHPSGHVEGSNVRNHRIVGPEVMEGFLRRVCRNSAHVYAATSGSTRIGMARSVTFGGGCGGRNPCSPERLPYSTAGNSLFPNLGNSPSTELRGAGIGDRGTTGMRRFERIPCTFPADQGIHSRDEFAPDCPLRQLVRVIGDGDAGARMAPPKPRVFAGFWARALAKANRRLRVPGLEDAAGMDPENTQSTVKTTPKKAY
jgi:hypothetical protein